MDNTRGLKGPFILPKILFVGGVDKVSVGCRMAHNESKQAKGIKTMDKFYIKGTLSAQGINFSEDFHVLPSSKVELLVEAAKVCKYRKPANASGSTARYFFYHLAKIKG